MSEREKNLSWELTQMQRKAQQLRTRIAEWQVQLRAVSGLLNTLEHPNLDTPLYARTGWRELQPLVQWTDIAQAAQELMNLDVQIADARAELGLK